MAVVLYLSVAALLLVARYGILPNIDHFRPRIQAELSSALGAQVSLGRIEAEWQGLRPRFQLSDVVITDDDGKQALRLPGIRAMLSWQGLLSGLPRFTYIEAEGLDIDLRLDAQQRIWVLGRDIDVQQTDDSSEISLDHPMLQWLAKQPRIALRDASISWRDETRDASVLRLEDVTLGLVSDDNGHRMSLSATPPTALGRGFEMRAEFNHTRSELPRTDPMAWEGMIYVNVDGMSPVHWRPWMDVPTHMLSGDVSAQWWLGFAQAEPTRVAAHVAVEQGHWLLGDMGGVRSGQVELFLDGSWQAYAGTLEAFEILVTPSAPERTVQGTGEPDTSTAQPSLTGGGADAAPVGNQTSAPAGVAAPLSAEPVDTSTSTNASTSTASTNTASTNANDGQGEGDGVQANKDGPPVRFWVDAKGLALETPEVFEHLLQFDHIAMQGGLMRAGDGKLAVRLDDTQVLNEDMDLQLHGTWREGEAGSSGVADVRGVFRRARLDGIDLYMPNSVNLDAREWLINGLLDGEIQNADAVLQGELDDFPFGSKPGQFRIEGSFRDGVIDYAPDPAPDESWPALRNVSGHVVLDRVDLSITAQQAVVQSAEGHIIQLRDVQARIPNIERNSILSIQGATRAPAPAYLALARHSPLQRLLDGFLDPASADGEWDVPLELTIPLLNVDDTKVLGSVNFEGSQVRLDPVTPPFEQVQGSLEFSETGFSADALKAQFLGGPADFTGGIGGARKGLEMKGRISAEALTQYVGVQGMKRLEGGLAYTAALRRRPSGRYALTAQADLRDLAIDLPEPAGKGRGAPGKLDIQWLPAAQAGRMHLKAALGSTMQAWFLRREGKREGPYFISGAIGTVMPEKLPAAGLVVDARHSHIDVNEWEAIVDEFSVPLSAGASGSSSSEPARELFPPLLSMRLQADDMHLYGLKLGEATLTARRESPQQWRMDVASVPTAGTLHWQQADAASTGRVTAHFDRLALGEAHVEKTGAEAPDALLDAAEEDGSWERDIDIPAIDLKVDKLSLYGRHAGKLEVEGVSEQGGRFWRLNTLSLVNPTAQLRGSGIWRLTGPQRGLTLDATVDFSDVGAFLDQINLKDVMQEGRGQIKGRFEWRNMPWRFKRTDLNGQLRVELEQGRFSTVNSRSARLLELLSLQSLQRLATFNLNPSSIFKEGFPFDRIAGTLHIQDGIMTTNDYQVISPVATISIGGDVDLSTEKIDLQAMVVPKLDVSGASVAAGIAINPIVGIGAFVTQWLLSKPLSKAMTVHYDVSGDLNAPQLSEADAADSQAAQPGATQPNKVPSGKRGSSSVEAPGAGSQHAPHPGQIEGGSITLNDEISNGMHDAQKLQ